MAVPLGALFIWVGGKRAGVQDMEGVVKSVAELRSQVARAPRCAALGVGCLGARAVAGSW